jgi:broad specificity phosphatase PhoE
MKYYITRHAIATKNPKGYGIHIYDAPILPEGIETTKRMGKYLADIKTDANLSSEFPRCMQTAEIITRESHKQFSYDKRINEFFDISFSDFVTGVNDFLREIYMNNYGSVLLCTHTAVIAVILCFIKRIPVTHETLQTNYPPPGMLLCAEENNIIEINFNNP